MSLKSTVDKILDSQQRSLSWLADEMDKTFTGFKMSLVNESIKYSDLKKMVQILNVPISILFEAPKSVQKIYGDHNTQAFNSMIGEPDVATRKWR